MKTRFFILLIVIGTLSACNKFVDTTPSDFYGTSNYYNTEQSLREALNGVYGAMTTQGLYGQILGFNFDVTTDELLTSRNQDGDTRGMGYNYDASNEYVARIYRYAYVGIANANLLLDNIDRPQMDETERGYIKGQALFLRAYFYFILVTNYGRVPLITQSISIADVHQEGATPEEIYATIERDLKEAEVLLAGRTSETLGYNDEVTYTAVQAMLAKVYLYWAGYPVYNTDKYEDVITYADKVIQSRIHQLHPDYSRVFINLCQDIYDTRENILEWGFRGAGGGVDNRPNDIGNFVGVRSGYIPEDLTSYASAGWVFTTRKLYDSYGVDPNANYTGLASQPSFDLRRDWNCANYYFDLVAPRQRHQVSNPWQMYPGKFRREYAPQEVRMGGTYNINWPALRYADVLLMKAEALNATTSSPTQEAYDLVNQVRRRGYGILYGNIVRSITVTNGGSGYSSANPPVVTISGGGGSGATATAVVSSSGEVTAVVLDSRGNLSVDGSYYTAVPTVIIAAPQSGTQATAVAAITSTTDADVPAGLDKVGFLEVIKYERMRELVAEGVRKHDLIRWGNFVNDIRDFHQYATANGGSGSNYNGVSRLLNVTEKHVLLPIPVYELNLNKMLKQNVGW